MPATSLSAPAAFPVLAGRIIRQQVGAQVLRIFPARRYRADVVVDRLAQRVQESQLPAIAGQYGRVGHAGGQVSFDRVVGHDARLAGGQQYACA